MRYCFFSDYKFALTGYTTMIINFIKGLHLLKKEIILINYKDGLVNNELLKEGIEIKVIEREDLTRKNVKDFFSVNDIFLVNHFPEFFNLLMEINPKIIYYDINDFIGEICRYKTMRLGFLGKKMVKLLLEKNALLFMDDTGVFNVKEYFKINIKEPNFLPIPINSYTENQYLMSGDNHREYLKVAYIGRVDSWKMYPLLRVLKDLSKVNTQIKVSILVDNIQEFEKYCNLNELESKYLTFKIYESLKPSEVPAFLLENADLYFGMGTTALHAGALGIPTILLDYSSYPINGIYHYNWLFESKHFSLGMNIDKREQGEGKTIIEIFERALSFAGRKGLSNETFLYTIKNHSLEMVAKFLVHYCERSSFRSIDARKYFPYYFWPHSFLKGLVSPFYKKMKSH